MTITMRVALLSSLWWFPGCGGAEPEVCDPVVCLTEADHDGQDVTCSFAGVEATDHSCDCCRARLYAELCAAGWKASVADVDAAMTCEGDDTGGTTASGDR